MEFIKYDALGNDYLVLDPASCDLTLDPAVIRRICDRRHGLGSDGILYGPHLDDGQYGLRIFNPDGTECEKSGNGLRIFARYLRDAGYVTAGTAQVYLMMPMRNSNIPVGGAVPPATGHRAGRSG